MIVFKSVFCFTQLMEFNTNTYSLLKIFTERVSWFEVFIHEPVTTSIDASKIRHGYGLSQGAKALVLKAGDRFLMVVVPGDKKINNAVLKSVLGVKEIRFATPEEVTLVTNGILIGGVPPFGSYFKLKTYVDATVLENEKIIFNCADRSVSVALKSSDYMQIEQPEIVNVVIS